jgi:hypothetical protein
MERGNRIRQHSDPISLLISLRKENRLNIFDPKLKYDVYAT